VIVDYHMHLRDPDERIDHTFAAVERYVEAAADRGVDEIGFTEHVYYFEQTRHLWDEESMLERCVYDLDRYVGAVVEAKERGLPVKLGLEVDYVAGRERETAEVFAPYPWDYLLGSVHFVDGFGVDQMPGLVEKLGPHEAWRRYFVWLRNAARSGLFDKPVGELYPDRPLLEACHARGVPITLASDAHVPQDLGRDLDRAVAHARDAGYETVSVFDRRQRRQEPLG